MMDDYGRQIDGLGRSIDDIRSQVQYQDREIAAIKAEARIYHQRIDEMGQDIAIIKQAVTGAQGGLRFGVWLAGIAATLSGAAIALWIFVKTGGHG